MSSQDVVLLAVIGAAILLYLEARDFRTERDEHAADAEYWLKYTCWLEGRGNIPTHRTMSPMQASQFIHDLKYGFADEIEDGVKLPDSFSFYTLDGLIRASGGKPS